MKKQTLRDVDVNGKKVLMRVDFNVPLTEDRKVADDKRIRAALPSIQYVLDNGGTVILMTHLGRPKGEVKSEYSLAPVAEHLGRLLDRAIHFLDDCVGERIEKRIGTLPVGEIALLENLRFHAGETKNDSDFSAALARLGDVYVNDAFGTAHRAHASTAGVASHFSVRAAGFLMEKEIDYFSRLLEKPRRPFVAILGGAKISGKIDVIRNLADRVDRLLVGGGMAGTFFAAKGFEIGDSLLEKDRVEIARSILKEIGEEKLLLPVDAVVADDYKEDAQTRVVPVDRVEEGWRILDIGPETIRLFTKEIESAGTVFWNGPMGVFEMKPFSKGTFSLADSLASVTDGGTVTVVGGGDSARAIMESGLEERISHVSTGGGASLEFMEGIELPGVTALADK